MAPTPPRAPRRNLLRFRPRRDQPRRLEVFGSVLVLAIASASGRLLGPPPLERGMSLAGEQLGLAGEQLQAWSRDAQAYAEELLSRLRRRGEEDATRQPEFAGCWRTARSVDLDDFLDRAMGVGYLKRTIAVKASQTQRLHQRGEVRAPSAGGTACGLPALSPAPSGSRRLARATSGPSHVWLTCCRRARAPRR